MREFLFQFDELPLVASPGIEAALINGSADISYTRDGQWEIGTVYVDGYVTDESGKVTCRPVLPDNALTFIILNRLSHEWRQKVIEAVREKLINDREAA